MIDMAMPPYPIHCIMPGCSQTARFKIASHWSDGITSELKTYYLCCSQCLPACYALAQRKFLACRLAPTETLGQPMVFLLQRGLRDQELERRPDLEQPAIQSDANPS
jgi:hypothetical protein